jgi:hypothetical protein
MDGDDKCLEHEAFIKARVDWAALTSSLMMAVAYKERADAGEDTALMAVMATNMAASSLLGETTRLALPEVPTGLGRKEYLLGIVDRLLVLSIAYPGAGMELLTLLAHEIEAVAHGDEPRLLAPVPSTKAKRRPNDYRVARLRLAALAWPRVLQRFGLKSGEAQSVVGAAFGISWDAIRRWPALSRGRTNPRQLMGQKLSDFCRQ